MIINSFFFSTEEGGDWSPADLSNLFAWYRGDTYVETSGRVSSWTDKSGNGRTMSQSTFNNQGEANSSGGPNSTPFIDFSLQESWYDCPSGTWNGPLEVPMTIVMVKKYLDLGVVHGANVALDEVDDEPVTPSVGFYTQFFFGSTPDIYYQSGDTNWHVHLIQFESNTPTIKFDGTDLSNSDTITDTVSAGSMRLGNVRDGYYLPFLGQMAEVIFIEGSLSSGDRTLLENYLSERYGLY